ncbi:hypothetical protein [Paragemmobacter straminiformis]|uniref:Uncharacterized protein n=1 Tax=Paragemmobacter straminiformis TaxID=2045119 RepID=A0A842I9Z3_9RHOB|nr:hypothetical protein [Gemmobacter straminiformis]MBC2836411.1 hypothetical protein [Gemmobacter straminiformis]
MTLSQLILSQLSDPFRIVLIVGLVITMLRTRPVTGTLLPLASGIAFVAIIIPVTITQGLGEPMWRQISAGLLSNAVILGIVLGVWELYRRARG